MELANKELHHAVSSPSHPGPGQRRLDIGARFDGNRPVSPNASRWLLKRVKRYSHIACVFRDLNSSIKDLNEGISTCSIPPLLPSSVADCAPTARLSLSLGLVDGPKFLAMLSGGDPPSAVLDPSWFRERLRRGPGSGGIP
ncbi:g8576 [Coccomyxa viridis]|uniref:G8576 protein n=1 Tax=Coccomyxa viridis TaxID=1274662 RepID=A0ABP1G0Q1_9CHLO